MARNPKGTTRFPTTNDGWRKLYLTEIAGRKGWPDNPETLLRPKDVAALIGVTPSAIYLYRRAGHIPIPDEQEGGYWPDPDEWIEWKGKKDTAVLADGTTVIRPSPTRRKPRPGEKLGSVRRLGWFAWRIYRWVTAERPGRGWHAKGEARVPLALRTRDVGPGEWLPPPPDAETIRIPAPVKAGDAAE